MKTVKIGVFAGEIRPVGAYKTGFSRSSFEQRSFVTPTIFVPNKRRLCWA
jgi:hypothetical protein